MIETIFTVLGILTICGAFLLWMWNLSAKIQRKKDSLDTAEMDTGEKLQELEERIEDLEAAIEQYKTKRIEKNEDNGTLIEELKNLLKAIE